MNGKISTLLVAGVSLLAGMGGGAPPALAQQQPIQAGYVDEVRVVGSRVTAINFRRPGTSGAHLDFRGTNLAPHADGVIDVDSKKGYVQLQSTVHDLPPASSFGDEYMTYVMWAITPEGRATNLGEFLVSDSSSRSRLEVTTDLQAFGMIVTAEPHFGVTRPSNVVVLENALRPGGPDLETTDARFELLETGTYSFRGASRADLDAPSAPFYVVEARNAKRIATDMDAQRYASDAYAKADGLLREAETAHGKQRMAVAKQAAQTFEDARIIATKAKREENERLTQLAAEDARRQAERAQADAQSARADASEQADAAQQARIDAERARLDADRTRAQAEEEKARLRAQLRDQFRVIFETRETARGLILSMSNVLFETNRATLLPGAREKLAKLAGVVLSTPGLQLAIEGHADSQGGAEYNQQLSERRASSVRDYLVEQGIAAEKITARGFGESMPVASNDTAEGRQQNRRVEMVVSGEVIGAVGE